MKKLMLVFIGVLVMFSTGCTMIATGLHNSNVNKSVALRVQPLADGRLGAQAGIEIYNTKGFIGLFTEEPAMGTIAVGLDIATIVGAFALYENMRNGEDVITEDRPTTSQTSGGDSVVIYGDNNTFNNSKSSGE